MHYIAAKDQRFRLNEELRRTLPYGSHYQLPECTDERPCTDGRCPICGFDLNSKLQIFFRAPNARARPWSRAAFVFDYAGPACSAVHDINQTITDISDNLGTGESALIATFGFLAGRATSQKTTILAVEVCATGCEHDIEQFVGGYLEVRYDCDVFLLPQACAAGFNTEYAFLQEQLLCGYLKRDFTMADPSRPVREMELLADLAQHLGPHRISDRLITHGLKQEKAVIKFAPGNYASLILDPKSAQGNGGEGEENV